MTKDVPPAEYLNVYPPKKCILLTSKIGPGCAGGNAFLTSSHLLKKRSMSLSACGQMCQSMHYQHPGPLNKIGHR